MKKIAIFYHLFQYGEWEKISSQQFKRLENSELLENADYVHIGINGTLPLQINLDTNNSIHYNSPDNFDGEMETMSDLHKFCVENQDYNVLFFHAKGVYSSNIMPELTENINSWKEHLERVNIDNWRKCVDLLETHDCVGTEWETLMCLGGKFFESPCYAGTFWWADSSYISKLDPNRLFVNEWGEGSRRFQCEFWIGTGNPKYYNFYTSKNKYYAKTELSEYEQFL